MSDESDFDCENNINETAGPYCDNLLPSVSRESYEKVFREFEAWCNRKKVKQVTEEVVLVYIRGKSKTIINLVEPPFYAESNAQIETRHKYIQI
jgi:hypothetical protein